MLSLKTLLTHLQVYLPMSYVYGKRGTCKETPLTAAIRYGLGRPGVSILFRLCESTNECTCVLVRLCIATMDIHVRVANYVSMFNPCMLACQNVYLPLWPAWWVQLGSL